MFLRKSLFGILGTILACGVVAFTQEPQPQTPSTPDNAFRKERIDRTERRREQMGGQEIRQDGRGRRGRGMGHLIRELNLTEEQRQQSRAIMQRRLESVKTQREELFKLREKRVAGTFTADDEARAKALRQEMRTAMEGVRTEMAAVLTEEQRTKLEQLKKERKEKFQERMKERQERLNQNPQ